MKRDDNLTIPKDAVERRLLADLPAAWREAPDGLAERVLARMDAGPEARRAQPHLLAAASLLAASLLIGWLFVSAMTRETTPAPALDLHVAQLRGVVGVDTWVATSADALHRGVDVALRGEWQAMVTDASRAASSVLDGFVRPLRGLSLSEAQR